MSGEAEVIRNILISEGKIKKISEGHIKADKYLNADFKFVIPGVIDPHVHFREPGLIYKEDLMTGSMAAAAGGITTFLDMPNTLPPTITIPDLEEKKLLARKSIVNYGMYFGAAIGNAKGIKIANKMNIAATKLFMNLSTGKMMIEDSFEVEKVFKASKMVAVHAEREKVGYAVHIAKKLKTKLYLCHISLKDEIDFLRDNLDLGIYAEATPHHLFLTEKDFKKQGAFAKMIPSLKKKSDQDALWDGIEEGIIKTIGTDHAPHIIQEKKVEDPPAGVPGVETMLPLMLDAVNKGRISMKKVVELTSRNPSIIFGIKNKAKIAPGYDADLTIIDMDLKREVKDEELKTKCKWSPFNGWKLKGWPVTTIVNGRVVFDHGKLYKNKGREVIFK